MRWIRIPELAREFLATYLQLRAPRPGFRERFSLYMPPRPPDYLGICPAQREVASKMGTLRDWIEGYTRIADTLGIQS
jgi:hypothetical protein